MRTRWECQWLWWVYHEEVSDIGSRLEACCYVNDRMFMCQPSPDMSTFRIEESDMGKKKRSKKERKRVLDSQSQSYQHVYEHWYISPDKQKFRLAPYSTAVLSLNIRPSKNSRQLPHRECPEASVGRGRSTIPMYLGETILSPQRFLFYSRNSF